VGEPRFQVIFSKPAERSLERLPQHVRRRILVKARALGENPWPPGFLRLTGADGYRVRMGDYRILYTVEGGRLVVLVLDVGHRKDIYRGI
jgi:mRNA interferase RelE/StbE